MPEAGGPGGHRPPQILIWGAWGGGGTALTRNLLAKFFMELMQFADSVQPLRAYPGILRTGNSLCWNMLYMVTFITAHKQGRVVM